MAWRQSEWLAHIEPFECLCNIFQGATSLANGHSTLDQPNNAIKDTFCNISQENCKEMNHDTTSSDEERNCGQGREKLWGGGASSR